MALNLKLAIEELMTLSDEEFSWYHINSDPIEGKINQEIRREIINKSLSCGYEQADIIREHYNLSNNNPDLLKLCKRMGIQVREDNNSNTNNFIYFGTYEYPGIITIYTDNIRKGAELAKAYDIAQLAKERNLRDIVLSHEIFHHIESNNQNLFVNTYRIKLWKLGPYIHRSPLICTGEIAGMAFARRLLKLQFCPNVLDVLLLYPHDKIQAEKLCKQILNLCKRAS